MARNLEDPSAAGSESPSRHSQCSNSVVPKSAAPKKSSSGMERSNRRMPSSGSAKCQKPSGSSTTQAPERLNNSHGDSASVQSGQEPGGVPTAPAATSLAANGDKFTVEVVEWPRIYISLSRKEKEDDFLAMKGTKIPQRPKKRAKNIDRTLQVLLESHPICPKRKTRYLSGFFLFKISIPCISYLWTRTSHKLVSYVIYWLAVLFSWDVAIRPDKEQVWG